ncbi:hypothetical protein ACJX0J_005596, partial [Zea mays]
MSAANNNIDAILYHVYHVGKHLHRQNRFIFLFDSINILEQDLPVIHTQMTSIDLGITDKILKHTQGYIGNKKLTQGLGQEYKGNNIDGRGKGNSVVAEKRSQTKNNP